jgi:hypothetical protein
MLDVKKPHTSYNQENPNEHQTLVDAIQRAEKELVFLIWYLLIIFLY